MLFQPEQATAYGFEGDDPDRGLLVKCERLALPALAGCSKAVVPARATVLRVRQAGRGARETRVSIRSVDCCRPIAKPRDRVGLRTWRVAAAHLGECDARWGNARESECGQKERADEPGEQGGAAQMIAASMFDFDDAANGGGTASNGHIVSRMPTFVAEPAVSRPRPRCRVVPLPSGTAATQRDKPGIRANHVLRKRGSRR